MFGALCGEGSVERSKTVLKGELVAWQLPAVAPAGAAHGLA